MTAPCEGLAGRRFQDPCPSCGHRVDAHRREDRVCSACTSTTAGKPPYSPSGEGSETEENVTYHRAADACPLTLGSKPWWMSQGQYDAEGGPCECLLKAGHEPPCLCEHTEETD